VALEKAGYLTAISDKPIQSYKLFNNYQVAQNRLLMLRLAKVL